MPARQGAFGDVNKLAWAILDAVAAAKLTVALGHCSLPRRRANFLGLRAADGDEPGALPVAGPRRRAKDLQPATGMPSRPRLPGPGHSRTRPPCDEPHGCTHPRCRGQGHPALAQPLLTLTIQGSASRVQGFKAHRRSCPDLSRPVDWRFKVCSQPRMPKCPAKTAVALR